ncbi:uncharacterized protein N7483_007601 [Penicillium malachiteum]|uniref:uncharacterized protein n=1 Tax=Penicillium malachiteum TaxID=1324776 RepID=UPI0025492A05|nr:uncharacterized protein N7483_007601 [Penicillium malachiteum]KAJ5726244.1 hypothetical protein N7483_007601 [Penicillium malachiteum]
MELFWNWATDPDNDEEKCADIDCIFLADFFNQKVLDNPVDLPGLDSSHQKIPMQRVMEMMGSEERTQNFAILHKTINLAQGTDSDIRDKFKAINVDVRQEIQNAQDQYKTTNGKDISLLDCYDAWMDYQLNSFVTDGKQWVKDAVKDLKKDWEPEESEDDDPLSHEYYRAVEIALDLLQGEADDAIDMSNFNLDLGNSDSMDTSDG